MPLVARRTKAVRSDSEGAILNLIIDIYLQTCATVCMAGKIYLRKLVRIGIAQPGCTDFFIVTNAGLVHRSANTR